MAGRPPARTTQHLRDLIKTEELIQIVQKNVMSPRAKPLNQTKMTGIKMLLNKVIPDLKAIEQTTEHSGTVTANVQVEFVGNDKDSK